MHNKAPGAMLVHGIPTGTCGEAKDRRYAHGWIEYPNDDGIELVYDPSCDALVFKAVYYAVGRIDEKETVRYTRMEALKTCLARGTYGPWEEHFNSQDVA